MPTTVAYSDAADGYIVCSHATYAAARGGTGGITVDGSAGYAGQTTAYGCYEGFLSFDTSGVSGTVRNVVLSLCGSYQSVGANFTMNVRDSNWGTTLDSADFVAGASLSALPLRASYAVTTAWPSNGTRVNFDSDASFVSNVANPVRLLIDSSRQESNTSPSAIELAGWYTSEATGTTNDPKLTIISGSTTGSLAPSCDGYTNCLGSSWANTRSGTGTLSVNSSNTTMRVEVDTKGGDFVNYNLKRAFLAFDTSAIGAGATVLGGRLVVKINSGQSSTSLSLVAGSQASGTALASSDHTAVGGTELATRKAWTGNPTSGTVLEFLLNASGVAAVNKSGYTKLALIESADFLNSPPADFSFNNVDLRTVEYTGTADDPILEIWYDAGSGAADLSGSSAASGSVSGTPSTTPQLAGSSAGTGATTASLSVPAAFSGSSAGTGSSTGNLAGPALFSGSTSGTGSTSGGLSASSRISGSSSAAGSTTGNVTAASQLSGSSAGSGSTTGNVTSASLLSGSSSAVGSASGSLTATPQLSGSSSATGTTSGSLTAAPQLSGSTSATGSVSGSVITSQSISGTAAGTGSTTGAMKTTPQIIGSSGAAGSTTGGLTVPGSANLSGSAAGIGAVTGNLSASSQLAGSTAGSGSTTGTLSSPVALSGSSSGSGSSTGSLGAVASISGSSSATSSVAGALNAIPQLSGSASATSNSTGSIITVPTIAGSANGVGSVSGVLSGRPFLIGTAAATSSVTGALSVPIYVRFTKITEAKRTATLVREKRR